MKAHTLTAGCYTETDLPIAECPAAGTVSQGGSLEEDAGAAASRDAALLRGIERLREALAGDLAGRNPDLTERRLNHVVQGILDGIVFLRMAEDRGVEEFGGLLRLLDGKDVFDRLRELFRRADERYNPGLSRLEAVCGCLDAPDALAPGLKICDEPLKDFISALYRPEHLHELSALPVDTLGQVHERLLGKTIRLVPGHRAFVEEKPEVRKAGGVYYTPAHIVGYAVQHTLGRLLEGERTGPRGAAGRLKVLDPACGSGSFLLGAYERLLEWHRDRYLEDGPEQHRNELYRGPDGRWLLNARERKRLLLDHIYGVDIDLEALEITRLSLLLKALEGVRGETPGTESTASTQITLSDLSHNLKCGNALIGPAFLQTVPAAQDEDPRLSVFDWKAAFPEVFSGEKQGFDVVIGNPPYVFGEYHDARAKQYLHSAFALASDQYDAYWLFIERGLQLTSAGGRLSLVVPDAVLVRELACGVRQMVLDAGLERIYHCGAVFGARVSTVVLTVGKGDRSERVICDARRGTSVVVAHTCGRERFQQDPRHRLLVHASDQEAQLLDRIRIECRELGEFVSISRGEETGRQRVCSEGPVPILAGSDVSRYHVRSPSRFVWTIAKSAGRYHPPKIVIVKTGSRCVAALDRAGLVTMQSIYNVHIADPDLMPGALLGILNSSFVRFFLDKTFTAYKLLFPQLNQTTVGSIPIPAGIMTDQHLLAEPVERMLSLHAELAMTKRDREKMIILHQIEATDRWIDQLVCESYGVIEEEIAVMDGSGSGT